MDNFGGLEQFEGGMEYACSLGADYIIWLNDDALPSLGTLPLMVSTCVQDPKKVVSAQCYVDSALEVPTYGGQMKGWLTSTLFHTPRHQILPCDCMSGNLVCFPRSVIETIGFPPSEKLRHVLADVVYTYKAKQAGYQLEVLGDATAVCRFNAIDEGWASSSIPMWKRWRMIISYRSNLYPPSFWYYCKCFYGVLAPIVFLHAYVKLIIFTLIRSILPVPILKRLKVLKDRFLQSQSPVQVVRNRSHND
jgi:GT2 family glycosyltransferase